MLMVMITPIVARKSSGSLLPNADACSGSYWPYYYSYAWAWEAVPAGLPILGRSYPQSGCEEFDIRVAIVRRTMTTTMTTVATRPRPPG